MTFRRPEPASSVTGYLNPDGSHEGDWVSTHQPRTAAGRALLAGFNTFDVDESAVQEYADAILAIEAEAAALDVERLAAAIINDADRAGGRAFDVTEALERAERLAAEYARLADEEGTT